MCFVYGFVSAILCLLRRQLPRRWHQSWRLLNTHPYKRSNQSQRCMDLRGRTHIPYRVYCRTVSDCYKRYIWYCLNRFCILNIFIDFQVSLRVLPIWCTFSKKFFIYMRIGSDSDMYLYNFKLAMGICMCKSLKTRTSKL